MLALLLVVGLGFVIAREESGQLDAGVLSLGRLAQVRVVQPKRFRQPAAVGQKPFGLARHVGLLQMVDQLRGPFADALAHRLDNASLGDAAKVIGDGRLPAGFDQIESGHARQPVRFAQAAVETVLADPSWRGEEIFFLKMTELCYREMRRHKPDALHLGCAGHYWLAEFIDLNRTSECLDRAANAMRQLAKSGKKIMFVATKKQARDIVSNAARSVGMPYVTERWLGGMMTNFNTVRRSVKKMQNSHKNLSVNLA